MFPGHRLADRTFPCALIGLLVARFQAYLYRKIFEEFFPTPAAAETVPAGPSIACSTARAIEWDESFKAREGSGRMGCGVSYFYVFVRTVLIRSGLIFLCLVSFFAIDTLSMHTNILRLHIFGWQTYSSMHANNNFKYCCKL